MTQRKNNQGGFSLLEVLVAFSIFAVSFGILLQIYSKGTSSARLSDEYATAVIIAQSSLANIGIVTFPETGLYEESNGKYLLTTSVQEINDDELLPETQKISKQYILLKVSWRHKGKLHSIQLNTIKLYPVT